MLDELTADPESPREYAEPAVADSVALERTDDEAATDETAGADTAGADDAPALTCVDIGTDSESMSGRDQRWNDDGADRSAKANNKQTNE